MLSLGNLAPSQGRERQPTPAGVTARTRFHARLFGLVLSPLRVSVRREGNHFLFSSRAFLLRLVGVASCSPEGRRCCVKGFAAWAGDTIAGIQVAFRRDTYTALLYLVTGDSLSESHHVAKQVQRWVMGQLLFFAVFARLQLLRAGSRQ